MSTVVESSIVVPLKHSPVARFYAIGQTDELAVPDSTDLRALRKVLAERLLPLPWEQALHIVSSLAASLHRIHVQCGAEGESLGLVHGKVSPPAIILAPDGTVHLTPPAQVGGKVTGYTSPEMCTGADIDRRTDIYSLGVVLYELTAGKRLHKATDEAELIRAITKAELTIPSSFMEFPAQLEEIISNCLASNPNERFQSAQNLAIALESFVRDYELKVSQEGFASFLEPLLAESKVVPELIIPEASLVRQLPDVALAVPKSISAEDTEPVPTQVLHQITGDELQLAEAKRVETERGVVPAYVSHEFSSNVVRRQEILPDPDEFLETTIQHRGAMPERFVDPADIESKGFSAPSAESSGNEPSNFRLALPAPSNVGKAVEIRSMLQPQQPQTAQVECIPLVPEPMVESKSSGRTWLIATGVAAALVATVMVWPQAAKEQATLQASPSKPDTGSIIVSGTAGDEVWLLLGRTPISSIAINDEPQHSIRVEHAGYMSRELTLGPETWERSVSGTRIASASLDLIAIDSVASPKESASVIPGTTPTGTRPSKIQVSTTPSGSEVWLYVGTTPEVRIGNVATEADTQLRIERNGKRVSNRTVASSNFDSDGVAKLEL